MTDNHPHDNCATLHHDQNADFTQHTQISISRRTFLGSVAGGMAAFFLTSPIAQAVNAALSGKSALLGFAAIKASGEDTVRLPKGYQYQILMSWGDPVFSGAPAFDPSGKATAAVQEQQFGDNTDGMSFFPLSNDRGVLAVNNEYINPEYMFAHQGKSMTAEDVKTAQAAHGVTIVEIEKTSRGWQLNQSAKVNRRITAYTPTQMTGPAAGDALLKTKDDPSGSSVLGTLNNCASGQTPWGTYLSCEENFNKYFGAGSENTAADQRGRSIEISPAFKRYGIKAEDKRFQWSYFDKRFNFLETPNEANRFGWIVEIDPLNPDSIPKKRTALGRFKHENAALLVDKSGHVVVYMGDDERGEHIYKYVSKDKYTEGADSSTLLDEGTLYVARFSSTAGDLKGKGEWIELSFGKNGLTAENGFNSQAEVLINTRLAATHVGATTMDRPEWIAVHPDKSTVFCTLTNNKYRGIKENQPLNGPNPRENNQYGQIIRWNPENNNHISHRFDWDLFVLAGNPVVHHNNLKAGSGNITRENMFNSPDGISFDGDGRLWIQTDGKYSNRGEFAGMGNNQMLCADPVSGEIRRFMTGPVACEVTGLAFSPDYTTLFVGIQHPGEKNNTSHFPDGGNSKPRSSIIAITKEDGGVIGS